MPTQYSANGHYYEEIKYSAGQTWDQVKAYAETLSHNGQQGYLATITSSGENAFIASIMDGSGYQYADTGGSDAGDNGNFTWRAGPEKGEAITYSNWYGSEPQNIDENVITVVPGFNYKWADVYGLGHYSYIVEYGGMSITPSYSLSRSVSSVDEGSSVTFEVSTTNVSSGTSLSYSISGISSSDISGGSTSGSMVVGSNGQASTTITLVSDQTTEGNETLTFTTQGQSSSVTVNDTSKTVSTPTYSIAASSPSVTEGSIASFVVTTTGVAAGTSLSYVLSGVGVDDITGGQITGSVTVDSNGEAAVSIPIAADNKTEGSESLFVTVQNKTASMIISDTSVGSTNTGTTINVDGDLSGNLVFGDQTTNTTTNTTTNNTTNTITNTTNTTTNIDNSITISDNRVWVDNDIRVFNANITNDSSVTTANIGNTTVMEGGDTNNVIVGSDAVDRLLGLGGDDYFLASAGDDVIDGGDGEDAMTFSQNKNNYSVTKSGDSFLVSDLTGSEGTDTISGVERLGFTDGVLALDVDAGGTAGQAYRLYQAAFARTPDMPGVAYHMNDMEANSLALWNIANNFLNSPEFTALYGTNPSDDDYINALYTNVLSRGASTAEIDWYKDQFNTGAMDKQAALIGFAESPENVTLVGSEIENGIWLPDA